MQILMDTSLIEVHLETGYPLNFQGKLKTKLDFVDRYNEPYRNATEIKYITYLQSITMDGQELSA